MRRNDESKFLGAVYDRKGGAKNRVKVEGKTSTLKLPTVTHDDYKSS